MLLLSELSFLFNSSISMGCSSPYHHLLLLLLLLFISVQLRPVRSDIASDRAECADQLVGLSTCLPYVEGSAKSPTPDCCSGLKTVLAKSPKCLCILIKDRNDPQLGIKINASLALALPTTCGDAAAISNCPKLLNLPPNSKEAQVFNQSGSTSTVKSNSGGSGSANTSSHESSAGGSSVISLWGVVVAGLLLLQILNS